MDENDLKDFNDELAKDDEQPIEAPSEEPKEAAPSEEPKEGETPAKEEKPESEDKPTTPEDKPEEEEQPPAPLTEDSVRKIMSDLRAEERASYRATDDTYKEIMDSYYPQGLDRTLVDTKTGQELKTIEDVIAASDGTMDSEAAAAWLLNAQRERNEWVDSVEKRGRELAELNNNFASDATRVIDKYSKLFEQYPQLQTQAYNAYMKTVEADTEKGIILNAPVNIEEFYDIMLQPYMLATEYQSKNPAPPKPDTPAEDRSDISSDGAPAEVDDPNDFQQQLKKEFSKKG